MFWSSDAPYYSPNKLLNKLYEERVSRTIVNAGTWSQTPAGAEVASSQAHSVVKFLGTLSSLAWRVKVKVMCNKIRLVLQQRTTDLKWKLKSVSKSQLAFVIFEGCFVVTYEYSWCSISLRYIYLFIQTWLKTFRSWRGSCYLIDLGHSWTGTIPIVIISIL